jgi:hypothetical protein
VVLRFSPGYAAPRGGESHKGREVPWYCRGMGRIGAMIHSFRGEQDDKIMGSCGGAKSKGILGQFERDGIGYSTHSEDLAFAHKDGKLLACRVGTSHCQRVFCLKSECTNSIFAGEKRMREIWVRM